MKPIKLQEKLKTKPPAIVCIGVFDGAHKGHQNLINQMIGKSKEMGLTSVIVSFYPHPKTVLGQTAPLLLNTLDERKAKLLQLKADHLIMLEFTKNLSSLTAEAFIQKYLMDDFDVKRLLIGYNQTIGNDRLSVTTLKPAMEKLGIAVDGASSYTLEHHTVSSSMIRQEIQNGSMTLANQLLGYPYQLVGKVVQGGQLGQTIGFPTANLACLEDNKVKPKQGVYLVKVTLKEATHYGMMNIGVRPTVADKGTLAYEVHLFNFSGNLYDEVITIAFIDYLRAEQKFNNLLALKKQLASDKETCLQLLHSNGLYCIIFQFSIIFKVMTPIKILVTGGTFEKEYNPITGELAFKHTHVDDILQEGRVNIAVNLEVLMLIDSLEMTQIQRQEIIDVCARCPEERIIIIHGTDTMVATASLLKRSNLDKTIVLTGAMVPYTVASSDAKFNLGCAFMVAQLQDKGVYIAMNGCCFDPDEVAKNRDKGFFEPIS